MDHLGLPFGAELTEEDEVPYLSANNPHQVPFLEYGKTNEAYQAAANSWDAESMSLYELTLETSEIERFLQTWLFFGLLQEFLGELFDHNDYVRTTHSKMVISTEKLPVKLRQWMRDTSLDQMGLTHLRQCLHTTYLALVATPRAFSTKVKIGIAATAEVIGTALLLAAKAGGLDTEVLRALGCWGDLDEQRLRVAEMQKRREWCPGQASLTLGKFHSLQAKIYLSKLTKTYTGHSHEKCTFEACRTWHIDISEYNTLHLHTCTCNHIEANQVEVIKVLKGGKNALLDLRLNRESNEISVNIVPAEPKSWYVALSHVWADGLGNPKINSLPQCQLSRIYDLLTGFCTDESTKGVQKRPYLWIDTLCCPVDLEGKLLALAKMASVYQQASHVLVLDSSLLQVDCKHLQPIELLSRLCSSGWMFRLWTLNETNLASKLCIQFWDGIIVLDQVFSDLAKMTEPETYHFTGELISEYEKLRIKSSYNVGNELWLLVEALRYRSICKISDEPVCVAAILRMKADIITGEKEVPPSSNHEDRKRVRDERMARLWRASMQGYPKISKALIYHVGDRLTKPGLRWAPSTLLNIQNTAPFFCRNEQDHAFPSENGLILSSAACSISVPERVDGILGRPSTAASSVIDVLKYNEHRWITIFSTAGQKKYPSGCDRMALYDIIIEAGRGAEFEILTEYPVNMAQGSVESMQCLLVTNSTKECHDPEPKMRNAEFVRQGWIGIVDENASDFLNSLLGQAQALQNDSITQEIHENSKYGSQDPRYLDVIKRLLEKVWSMVDQIEKGLDDTGKNLSDSGLGLMRERRKAIFALLSRFYRNRYLVKERDFPVTQKYCVD